MNKKIIIYGAGGYAKVIISLLRLLDWDIAGLIDDGIPAGTTVSGVKVLGGGAILPELRSQGITNAVNAIGKIGDQKIRWDIFEKLREYDFSFPTLIHPAAFVEDSATLADGIQVLAQSYISSECQLGFGTLVNPGVQIPHEADIGRCVNLYPGALLAGNVTVGDFTQIGMGATINMEVRVGSNVYIGNSAVVKADVPDGTIIPAGTIWPPVSAQK